MVTRFGVFQSSRPAAISRPPWCRVRLSTSPDSLTLKMIRASTTSVPRDHRDNKDTVASIFWHGSWILHRGRQAPQFRSPFGIKDESACSAITDRRNAGCLELRDYDAQRIFSSRPRSAQSLRYRLIRF